MKNIPLMKVYMPPKEELMPELEEILYSGMITEGEKVYEFERMLQNHFHFRWQPLTTNSGTAALQLAYRAINIKDKIVITTPMTCWANVCSILNEGGKVVWADVDPDTGNISVADVKRKIEEYGPENIACVSFVDLAGFPADLKALENLCAYEEIALVEDAAQSLGARRNGLYIGASTTEDTSYVDHITCFSFQAIKHLTTIDGGMVVVGGNKDIAKFYQNEIKRLKWFGIPRDSVKEETRWHYNIHSHGSKWHMNNVNATVGISQLRNIDRIIEKHVENGQWLDKNLKNVHGIQSTKILENTVPSYWIYPVLVERKEEFSKMMKSKGIGTNIAHVRNDSYTAAKDPAVFLNMREKLPGLDRYEKEYIFMPCGWWVTPEDREYVLNAIKEGW